MICGLAHFLYQRLHVSNLRAVRRDGDGFGAGAFVGERIEGFAGGIAGCLFARGDVDFGAAGLEEAIGRISVMAMLCVRTCERYPEAAWSPKPREPPVTTATFPSREKMEEKSFRVV